MIDPADRVVRAIARRNSYALVWLQFGVSHLIALGGIGLLRLYQPMSTSDLWTLIVVSQVLIAIDNLISVKLTRWMWRPVWAWERGARDPASTIAARTRLATLPLEYTRLMRRCPFFLVYVPFIAFTTWTLHLRWYSFFTLVVGGCVVLLYGLLARYFTMEVVARPVLEEIAKGLPVDFEGQAPALPLRWRLFAAAPIINIIITGVVVAGLSTEGHHARLSGLGLSVLVAVLVSFTISLELIGLVTRSLGRSLNELQHATEQVRAGDYTARVPVVATDETGRLARSFNTMVVGLHEREQLRRLDDHAARAVTAALEITQLVRERYAGRVEAPRVVLSVAD